MQNNQGQAPRSRRSLLSIPVRNRNRGRLKITSRERAKPICNLLCYKWNSPSLLSKNVRDLTIRLIMLSDNQWFTVHELGTRNEGPLCCPKCGAAGIQVNSLPGAPKRPCFMRFRVPSDDLELGFGQDAAPGNSFYGH